jgi:hypothetical protein
VLAHPWICKKSQNIAEIRKTVDLIEQFEAFSTTNYKSPKTSCNTHDINYMQMD